MLGGLSAFAPLATDMYLPAMPRLERVFATDAARVQWTLAAFFLGFALGQAFYGAIADRYGRKPSLYAGLVLYIGASVGCALAPGIGLLAALRFLEAIGACAGAVIARAVVSDLFTGQEAARLFAALMAVMGIGPIIAPLIGGYLLLWFDWQAVFWVLAAFGVACLLAVWLRLPETHRPETVRSLALVSVTTRYLMLLVDRRYLGYALSAALGMAGLFAYIAGSPFVFITLHRLTPQHYAWLFGANAFGIVLASRVNHALLRRYSADALLVGANLAQVAAGVLLLAAAATGEGGAPGLAAPLFLYVACVGIVMPNSVALAMAPHRHAAGVASALLGVLQFSLAAAAAALIGALHSGGALPMAALILAFGLLSFGLRYLLVGRVARGAGKGPLK
ncbi:MAG TPA: multidrug effflux MFS transporter [Stellaceae bacterium]|nr:multidrug effflux MFS transporter [Stellaceae bacterium]